MNKYTMKTRTIPLDNSWDVVVIGGGPAGCTATIASAREGAKTLLIEATGCLGGMGTSGLVPAWCPFSDKEKIIYRGLAEKILLRCKKDMPHLKDETLDWVPIDPELLKRIYDQMVIDSGAEVLFNTFLTAVEMGKKGVVSAIITSNKSGLTAYKAKVYIDCTGDADLAAWAGASFQKGDSEKGLQPATHCFILTNVNENVYLNGPKLYRSNTSSPIYKILDSGKYPLIRDTHICDCLIGPATVGFNAGHIWDVDNTNPESVSKALIEGRKIAESFRNALAEFYPSAFGNSFLVTTASLMGIRETRRIVGDYTLTMDDYLSRRSFPDNICRNSYYIDVHPTTEEAKIRKDKRTIEKYKKGESHGIPYRCLTPKDIKNVLVAGRSISCNRMVQGSIRVMPVCLTMGEAAGIAGAQTAKTSEHNVHSIDIDILRKRIKEEGGYI